MRGALGDVLGQPELFEEDNELDDVPAVRDALMSPRRLSKLLFGPAADAAAEPRPTTVFVERSWEDYQAGKVGNVVAALPGLLQTAQALEDAEDVSPSDREQGWAVSARTHHLAATTLANGRFSDALELADTTAAWLQPRITERDPAAISLLGMIYLRAAVAAARHQDRSTATELLRLGLVEVDVKSRAGRRTFALPDELFELLMRNKERQAAERKHAGTEWYEGDWIFTQPNGKPLDPRADYAEWKELLDEAGVREARLHDARHTAATVLLILGVQDRTAMDIMGWSSPSMKKHYMHVTDEIRREVSKKINDFFWRT